MAYIAAGIMPASFRNEMNLQIFIDTSLSLALV